MSCNWSSSHPGDSGVPSSRLHWDGSRPRPLVAAVPVRGSHRGRHHDRQVRPAASENQNQIISVGGVGPGRFRITFGWGFYLPAPLFIVGGRASECLQARVSLTVEHGAQVCSAMASTDHRKPVELETAFSAQLHARLHGCSCIVRL